MKARHFQVQDYKRTVSIDIYLYYPDTILNNTAERNRKYDAARSFVAVTSDKQTTLYGVGSFERREKKDTSDPDPERQTSTRMLRININHQVNGVKEHIDIERERIEAKTENLAQLHGYEIKAKKQAYDENAKSKKEMYELEANSMKQKYDDDVKSKGYDETRKKKYEHDAESMRQTYEHEVKDRRQEYDNQVTAINNTYEQAYRKRAYIYICGDHLGTLSSQHPGFFASKRNEDLGLSMVIDPLVTYYVSGDVDAKVADDALSRLAGQAAVMGADLRAKHAAPDTKATSVSPSALAMHRLHRPVSPFAQLEKTYNDVKEEIKAADTQNKIRDALLKWVKQAIAYQTEECKKDNRTTVNTVLLAEIQAFKTELSKLDLSKISQGRELFFSASDRPSDLIKSPVYEQFRKLVKLKVPNRINDARRKLTR